MPYGKHKDKTVTEIVIQDISYAVWVRDNFNKPNIADRFHQEIMKQSGLKQEPIPADQPETDNDSPGSGHAPF